MITRQAGQLLGQRRRGGQSVQPGHLHVQQRHVRCAAQRRRDDIVTRSDLGDHPHVRLQPDQGREGAADHGLVVGEQHPDAPVGAGPGCVGKVVGGHDGNGGDADPDPTGGRVALSTKPPPGCGPATTVPPRASIRRVNPRSPLPCSPAVVRTVEPSSRISMLRSPRLIRQVCASECRTTLVTPSRTT